MSRGDIVRAAQTGVPKVPVSIGLELIMFRGCDAITVLVAGSQCALK